MASLTNKILMIRTVCCLVFIFVSFTFYGQNNNKSFTVRYISETIVPDGALDEEVWFSAESAHDFWEYFPVDSIQAVKQTDIKMLYDDKNLYIGITVYTAGRDYAVESLRRDFRAGNSDNITLLLTPLMMVTMPSYLGLIPLA